METVHIYRLQPNKKLSEVLRDAQMEAAEVWLHRPQGHRR